MKAVVLVSGGMDSAVAAAVAAAECDGLAFLHLNYGQRTEEKELECFERLGQHFGATKKLVVNADFLKQLGGSSLTDETIHIPENDKDGQIPSTYVPFRNTHLIALAVSWAEVIGARRIYIGVVGQDRPGYPDCRVEYIDAMNKVIAVGSRAGANLRIVAPLVGMDKTEVVKLGNKLAVPFGLTWSCYQAGDVPCGKCTSCRLRAEAFRAAGVPDPLGK
ncbi:MAG: 7-cyano-7-deazaguanine synthase QueC [Planctomycetia bacterium]|nr:7-cyano-7-deazaguanine synthase QueC [Planctomycetia bacterium]